ncbi:MAG TPA: ATP-binding protein [Pyrinomonadaceae bacterium]|nr:ATP-binding protein [Pyrinomonadaceae bacterium]
MRRISDKDVIRRIRAENPWWEQHEVSADHQKWKPRGYFDLFFPLVTMTSPRRAVVLMGPRRVGKTVMIHHAIKGLLESGVTPASICYFSVDHPIYNELSLEKLLKYYAQASGIDVKNDQLYVFFDEIQYLRKWEIHLKSFVDTHRNIKSVASGSAAAALKLRSTESGAGRFTDFLLPPLTFYEYIQLLNKSHLVAQIEKAPEFFHPVDIEELNREFLEYLNFGGYPEVIFSPTIQSDPGRFIKSDIIDKVLLRDLPGLYGIRDIQELNYLFTTLAFNTANEISLEELSANSGVAKKTIKRYIEYLEAAFLIKVVHRIDRSAKRFRRANFFKVYLTNPSMRAALFSPVTMEENEVVSALAETAIYSQWFHSGQPLYYARWNGGEVDIVHLNVKQKAGWVVEVKWSDRFVEHPEELKSLTGFCRHNKLPLAFITSRTQWSWQPHRTVPLFFIQASIYCYTVGANILKGMKQPMETSFQQLGFHISGPSHQDKQESEPTDDGKTTDA